jgi:hypothetical protein
VCLLQLQIYFCTQSHFCYSDHAKNKRLRSIKYDSALYLFISRLCNRNNVLVYLLSGIIGNCFVYACLVYLQYIY